MNCRKYLPIIALLLGACSICPAQSRDINAPTPLGPGVNKGNIDNMGNGPHFYYFTAGPGKFDLHYAFHEMGVFGNPFRQVLYFDVIDESRKVLTHDGIQSMGKLERFTHSGVRDRPTRFIIRVVTQPGVIRLGGYYEIEVTGMASFDGKTAGEGTTLQQSESLVKPGGPLVQSGGPLVQPGGPLVRSVGPLVHSVGPLVQPVGALVNVQQTPQEVRLTLAADILFDFDQATIRPNAKEALDRVAETIRTQGSHVVRIEGFTDAKGRADYNLRLSTARAQAVERWLIERNGIASTGLSASGFGATRFAAPNTKPDGSDDPEGRQKNRRVEVVVQKKN
jgi:outer membrane protein OmpA-like peptidoglycan-associated protein